MMRLALFEQGDPYSKNYDPKFYESSEKAAEEYVEPFPNGFQNWQETHYEICSTVGAFISKNHNKRNEVFDTGDSAEIRSICKQWTDEFELLNKGREWDGEWMEEIETFVNKKLNHELR